MPPHTEQYIIAFWSGILMSQILNQYDVCISHNQNILKGGVLMEY